MLEFFGCYADDGVQVLVEHGVKNDAFQWRLTATREGVTVREEWLPMRGDPGDGYFLSDLAEMKELVRILQQTPGAAGL